MKIMVQTIRHLRDDDLKNFCDALRRTGVPGKVLRDLQTVGYGEWSSVDNGKLVTTRYEVLKEA